jgi:hypothetical protein
MSESSSLRSGKDAVVSTLDDLLRELSEGADWENDTLARYLEALGALLDSIENSYANKGEPVPDDPWELMIRALKGARYYE